MADVYDALTSERPYRRPVAPRDAAAAIEEMSGSHFDPRVVQAFRAVPMDEWSRMARRVEAVAWTDTGSDLEAMRALAPNRVVPSDGRDGLS